MTTMTNGRLMAISESDRVHLAQVGTWAEVNIIGNFRSLLIDVIFLAQIWQMSVDEMPFNWTESKNRGCELIGHPFGPLV